MTRSHDILLIRKLMYFFKVEPGNCDINLSSIQYKYFYFTFQVQDARKNNK
jgi:hypothetical protein